MELINQVSNKELSMKLRDLGVPQESLFYWVNKYQSGWQLSCGKEVMAKENVSAYTCSELGELIPSNYWGHQTRMIGGGYSFHFGDEEYVGADNEVDARAKMLIYLLENSLIKLK